MQYNDKRVISIANLVKTTCSLSLNYVLYYICWLTINIYDPEPELIGHKFIKIPN